MCESCSAGPTTHKNRDSTNPDFAGFFSSKAIEAAIHQARIQQEQVEEDDDGT
jgi:hypothetical protein